MIHRSWESVLQRGAASGERLRFQRDASPEKPLNSSDHSLEGQAAETTVTKSLAPT